MTRKQASTLAGSRDVGNCATQPKLIGLVGQRSPAAGALTPKRHARVSNLTPARKLRWRDGAEAARASIESGTNARALRAHANAAEVRRERVNEAVVVATTRKATRCAPLHGLDQLRESPITLPVTHSARHATCRTPRAHAHPPLPGGRVGVVVIARDRGRPRRGIASPLHSDRPARGSAKVPDAAVPDPSG